MIPVGELRTLGTDFSSNYRVLKPWWDVFSEYLCIAMLMIGFLGCTMQLTQDKISCLPNHFTSPTSDAIDCSNFSDYGVKLVSPDSPLAEVFGLKNRLDVNQYMFVNYYCYESSVHWYPKYFPYLVVMHTVIFMVASSFWFKFPGTSSKIDLFANILDKCFDSPWTTRALSKVSEVRGEENLVSTVTKSSTEQQMDEEETVGLRRSSSIKSNPENRSAEPKSTPSLLDKKEGEQAKALFEKVKKLRVHIEERDILYQMYVLQTSVKVIKFILIIAYTIVLVPNIQTIVHCLVPPDLTGFNVYCCNQNKAHLLSKLSYCYVCFVGVFGLLCIYTLYWLFHRPLKEYYFEQVRLETGINDIPDVKNDFAFLLHLVDQYDSLYSRRFAVFLSEFSESHLYQLNLNYEWTEKKLRARLAKNSSNRLELHLLMLPGLPDAVFDIPELESLKLEQMSNITIPASVTMLTSLQELSLIYCPAKLHEAALNYLKEHLKILHLTFKSLEEVPTWIYTLHCLEELHLDGPLTSEVSKGLTLDSLKELKALRVLTFRPNLTKIPSSIADVALQLQQLCIYNENVNVQALSILKKLTNLVSLVLVGCDLKRIPSAVFSLNSLQELDLKENKLATVEEILSLQHCQDLVTLRLWHNKISYISDHIARLHSLETLDISWNKLRKLPTRLFYCSNLRHLDVSHNHLTSLPSEVNMLQSLEFFSAAFNSLESVPETLFACKMLKMLILGNNRILYLSPRVANLAQLIRLDIKGNRLQHLPQEIGNCPLLRQSGLIVEDNLLDQLQSDVRSNLNKS